MKEDMREYLCCSTENFSRDFRYVLDFSRFAQTVQDRSQQNHPDTWVPCLEIYSGLVGDEAQEKVAENEVADRAIETTSRGIRNKSLVRVPQLNVGPIRANSKTALGQ